MALSASNLTAGGSGAAASSYVTASISPASNALILATILTSTSGANTPTLTGAGMTWVHVVTYQSASRAGTYISIFRAMSSSPGSGALTFDFAGQNQGAVNWAVDQFIGADISGSNGSGAIVQTAENDVAANPLSSGSVTLAALSSPNNAAYGFINEGDGLAVTKGANFSELSNHAVWDTEETEWAINQTVVNWTWPSSGADWFMGVAIEIKAAVISPIELINTPLFQDANLVAYYRGENVNDSKGSRTLTNHGTTPFNPAMFGNAPDGGAANTTKWLDYTADNYGIDGGAISYGGWCKLDSEPTSGQLTKIFDHVSNTAKVEEDILYQNSSGTLQLVLRRIKIGISIDSVTFNFDISTSTFHHIFMTYDGTTLKLYIDGSCVGSVAASGSGNTTGNLGFAILNTPTGAFGNGFPGLADDVPIFNRALTATEVYNLYSGNWGSPTLLLMGVGS